MLQPSWQMSIHPGSQVVSNWNLLTVCRKMPSLGPRLGQRLAFGSGCPLASLPPAGGGEWGAVGFMLASFPWCSLLQPSCSVSVPGCVCAFRKSSASLSLFFCLCDPQFKCFSI